MSVFCAFYSTLSGTHVSLVYLTLWDLTRSFPPPIYLRYAMCKVCSVCSSRYGRGVANQCHLCTKRFEGAMYFVVSVVTLLSLVVIALLAVYLVRSCR